MNSMPLVSFVTTCKNSSVFLERGIESVLCQDYPNVEHVVQDAASTDGTVEVLQKYTGRVNWVSELDDGQGDGLTRALKRCHGDIIALLDADNIFLPYAASWAVENFRKYPDVAVIYGDSECVDAEGNHVYVFEGPDPYDFAKVFCVEQVIPAPAAFIRRPFLQAVGFHADSSLVTCPDYELWVRLGLKFGFRHVKGVVAQHTTHPGSGTAQAGMYGLFVNVKKRVMDRVMEDPSTPRGIVSLRRRARAGVYNWAADSLSPHDRLQRIRWLVLALCAQPRRWRLMKLMLALLPSALKPLRIQSSDQHIHISVTVPDAGLRLLRRLHRGAKRRTMRHVNLLGDRDIEWSWVCGHMPKGPGEALDFGNGGSHLALIAAQREFNVTAVDLEPVAWNFVHPRLRFLQGDILHLPLPAAHFDLVINCSTVEHVGLVGRYGVADRRPDGDLQAMARLRELMKPGAVMLLTVPVGRDAVFMPMCRTYGMNRLPRLLAGYAVETEAYWVKDARNRWVLSDKETALRFEASAGSSSPLQNVYGLGCFVLRRPE